MTSQPSLPQDLPQVADAEIKPLIEKYLSAEGPLLPMLHEIQGAFGFVPANAVPLLAEALNLTRAEVTGVISFYHDFRKAPAGKHVLKICRAEACQSMGAEALTARMLSLLGLEDHGTTADSRVTVEAVYCLGLCACAPAAMLDGQLIGRASVEGLEKALEGAA
ncbi:formate dehydrogenase gamma subunit [Pseudooceanicola antarcticus]|uniref:Formate dehydrogenase gamma subunit n=1 Tax=Pseudooceanicola antarcticus TaxID=1247613 RepID=A0A285J3T6_9RHOB|nr:formate dehydrogenase subunit gamma [Pseudooceanicola antarcticus]PJE29680.1 formate dehydrogenase subunit gamma [Pseudooceanicola antarcticus]SNY54862.1 formate dehydrogenase gamma subunit [Pseudooceanicola antarcticus]